MLAVITDKFPVSQTVSSASTIALCLPETQQHGQAGRRVRLKKGMGEK